MIGAATPYQTVRTADYPSEQEVQALLLNDQLLYQDLAQAQNLIKSIEDNWHTPLLLPEQDPVYLKYQSVVDKVQRSWYRRQATLKAAAHEEGKDLPTALDIFGDYSDRLRSKLVDYFNWGLQQIGLGAVIVPIAIIAAAIIAVSVSAAGIIDMLTVSSEERAELLDATSRFIQDTGLSPQQAQQLIKDTLPEPTTVSFDLQNTVIWGGLALILLKAFKII